MADAPDNENIWHDLLLNAVVATLETLFTDDERGIGERVMKWKSYDTVGTMGPIRPCIVVSIDDSRETCGPFSTEEDERILPITVTYLDRKDRKSQADLTAWLTIRQKLTNAFLMQLFNAVVKCWHVEVRPLDVLDLGRLIGPGLEDAVGSLELLPAVITERVRPVA